MKSKIKYLVPALVALAAAPFVSAAENAPQTQAAQPAKIEISPAQRQLFLQGLGWLIAQQSGLAQELGIAAEDVPAVVEGFRLALDGKGDDIPAKIMADNDAYGAFIRGLQAAVAEKAEAAAKKASTANKKLGAEFVAKTIAEDKTFTRLPSGVLFKKIADGDAAKKPTVDDVVAVRYTGKLIDGSIFDSSERNPQTGEPVAFTDKSEAVELPLGQLIPAWIETIPQLGIGGKCTLVVPAEQAYGDRAAGMIPPGSTLIFDIELVDIPAPEAPATAEETDAPAK